jgi:tRNA A-37 threonylcarbamoyl transferase component Bud32
MNPQISIGCSVETLREDLAGFRVTTSLFFPDFSLENLMAEITSCRIIKENDRRQIYYLQTKNKGYFLKRSTLVRSKDRWRHFLLPFRKWAEWRNLHRLLRAQIPTAKPVLRGEYKAIHPRMFFLLTEKVRGVPLKINSSADASKIGEYAAFLHSHGVYHADLHPNNIIQTSEDQLCLIDVQEVFFLPWMPRRLRLSSLGKIYFNLCPPGGLGKWSTEFLAGYNQKKSDCVNVFELIKAAGRHQQRKYRSRSKRCCKNSTEFVVVKDSELKGYKRRDFGWGAKELWKAVEKGQSLKESQVIYYQDVCIKKQRRGNLHRDRCKASWKMSRALEVRGIAAPRALGYFVMNGSAHFLSEFMLDSLHLNDYLSCISDPWKKRRALKALALWLRKIHDADVWQRDFKSNNILCRQGSYYMIDLDGMRIRRLTNRDRITNLAQLNASLSNAVTVKDRLRFFHYYAAGKPESRRRRREHYKEIWDITKTKGTSYYGLYLEEFKLCRQK